MNRQNWSASKKKDQNARSLLHACRWVVRACSDDFRTLGILVLVLAHETENTEGLGTSPLGNCIREGELESRR